MQESDDFVGKKSTKSHGKHVVEEVTQHTCSCAVSERKEKMSARMDEGGKKAQTHRHTEKKKFESSDQASHGSPARFYLAVTLSGGQRPR